MQKPLCLPFFTKKQTGFAIVCTAILMIAAGCGSASRAGANSNSNSNSSSAPTALWVANSRGQSVDAFSINQLSAGGDVAPSLRIGGTNTGLGEPNCMAFDRAGNLWVVDSVGTQVSQMEEFQAASLSAGGNLTPAVIISGSNTTLGSVGGCQFDSEGKFWVANMSSVVAFSPAQLRSGGNTAPAIQIAGSNPGSCMGSLTFDRNGNLWVSNLCNTTVVEFKASDLPAGGNLVPAVTITGTAPAQNSPGNMTFDSSGNLWVANSPDTINEYKASDLISGGNLLPAVTIQCNQAGGVVFDPKGDLWVSQSYVACTAFSGCIVTDSLVMYSASSLAPGGNLTPTLTVTGPGTQLAQPVNMIFH